MEGKKGLEGEKEAIKAHGATQEENNIDAESDVGDTYSSALLNRVCMLNHPPYWRTVKDIQGLHLLCMHLWYQSLSSYVTLADLQANGMLQKLEKETDCKN